MIPAALSHAATASEVVFAGRGLFRGFAYAETGGAAASVTYYDAAAVGVTTKPLVPVVTIAANGDDVVSLGAMVAAVERGLVVVVTGALTVVTFHNPETRYLTELGLFNDGTLDTTELGAALLAARMGS